MIEFKKLNVKWTSDIQQDLDSLCNPKSPFYDVAVVTELDEAVHALASDDISEILTLIKEYIRWKESLA